MRGAHLPIYKVMASMTLSPWGRFAHDDAFERSAEDELGCLARTAMARLRMMPRRQRRLAIGMVRRREGAGGARVLLAGDARGRSGRRYGLSANQVNAWRALARRGKLTSPSSPATEDERPRRRRGPWPRARPRSSRALPHPGPSPLSPRLRWRRRRVRFGRFGVDRGRAA